MSAEAKAELDAICSELSSIIAELKDISAGVRTNFTGVGNDKCADCLDRAVSQYYYVRRKLRGINIEALSPKVQSPGEENGTPGGGW